MNKTTSFVSGGRYNWKNQPERLIYKGHNFSGNGYWYQFAKVESPGVVWCEVLTADLGMFEETKEQPAPDRREGLGAHHVYCRVATGENE